MPSPRIDDIARRSCVYRHIGIYAYRCGFLVRYPTLAAPALEAFEALEQLRALWHGHRICVAITHAPPEAGVDTAEDLETVRRLFAAEQAMQRSGG